MRALQATASAERIALRQALSDRKVYVLGPDLQRPRY